MSAQLDQVTATPTLIRKKPKNGWTPWPPCWNKRVLTVLTT
jgi:hypothetical protein